MSTIAWLGTGLLGSGFVRAAAGRGVRVRVWNRTPAKAEALAGDGVEVASSPARAVEGVDRVHLTLSDDAAVDGVLDGLLGVSGFRGPVIDHTTVSPEGARRRAARLAERGIGFLCCPVFMSPANAREATGRMLCAGPAPLVAELLPHLTQMTADVVVLGDDVGRPAALKLIGNGVIFGLMGVLADGLAIGQGAGLTVAETVRFMQGLPLGGFVAARAPRMEKGDYSPASFELTMARKDARLMLEAAAGKAVAVLPGIAARMDALIARGHGELDLAALAIDAVPPLKSGAV